MGDLNYSANDDGESVTLTIHVDGQCGHVWADWVATAMAQIVSYWGYPYKGQGSHSYTSEGYPEQLANFSIQYD